MDFSLTKEEEALKLEFDQFFKEEMKKAPPEYRGGGIEGIYGSQQGFEFHKQMAEKMGEKGWISMAWPKKYGGKEATIMEQMIFGQVRGKYNAPGIDVFAAGMFAPTLLAGANEEQKERLLPPIAKGEVFYCQGWSEPDAGSDLASLTTMAIGDGDHYVVNGQKTWTTGAHLADHMFLLARTDSASKRGKGLSVFNVKMDLPGIQVRPLLYMNGKHVYNEVFFRDVRVPAEDLIGVEGAGWELTRQTMNFERSGSGSFSSVKQAIQSIVEYTKTTKRNGKFLADDPNTRRKLAKLFVDAEVGDALANKIAWYQQKQDIVNVITGACESKLFATELAQRMANFATEIMGPYGQLEYSKWAPLNGSMVELYQFCIGMNIYAGSNEIQRNLIAWVGMGLPRLKFQ